MDPPSPCRAAGPGGRLQRPDPAQRTEHGVSLPPDPASQTRPWVSHLTLWGAGGRGAGSRPTQQTRTLGTVSELGLSVLHPHTRRSAGWCFRPKLAHY